jgi:HEAT repeat protein
VISTAALRWVVLAELVTAAVLVASLAWSAVLAARRRRRDRYTLRWLAGASLLVTGASQAKSAALAELCRLRRRQRVAALMRALESVAGIAASTLAALAGPSGVQQVVERWCRSMRWSLRLRGARVLTALGSDSALVDRLLRDRRPEVRAEAAALVVAHPSPARIAELVAMLEDGHARCRFAAKDALIRTGVHAAVALAEHFAASGPAAAAALEVAAGVASPRLVPAALARSCDAEPVVRLWAANLLAAAAGPQARDELVRLLRGDPDAGVRAAAANGLAGLGDPTVAVHLAAAMADGSWDVRRAAAVGLRALGPSGRLYLRRTLAAGGPLATDMARQVLDEPTALVGAR